MRNGHPGAHLFFGAFLVLVVLFLWWLFRLRSGRRVSDGVAGEGGGGWGGGGGLETVEGHARGWGLRFSFSCQGKDGPLSVSH